MTIFSAMSCKDAIESYHGYNRDEWGGRRGKYKELGGTKEVGRKKINFLAVNK